MGIVGNKKGNTNKAGRKKGVPNKTTSELRAMVNQLVSNEMGRVTLSLDKVRKVNPAKYLDIMVRLVELVAPPVKNEVEQPNQSDWYADKAKEMMKKVS